jgi:hypothetical protein
MTLDGEDVFSVGLDSRSVAAARDPALFQAWTAWVAAHRQATRNR